MAYEKQNFTDGSVLTAAQLNHIEDGIKEHDTELDNLGKHVSGLDNRVIDLENNTNGSIIATAQGEAVAISDSADKPLVGLTLYGKTTQNGTPTPDMPIPLESIGKGEAAIAVTATITGKNLLGFQNLKPTVSQGGQIEIQDGVITRTATVTANVINVIPTELAAHIIPTDLSPGTYLYSVDYLKKPPQWLASTKAYLKVILDDGTEVKIYEGVATELTQSGVISGVCVSILSMAVGDVLSFQPQLACGTVSTAYEPYKEAQTFTAYTPNGLPGIPVTSGGNYTDEKGQQWVCDEVDLNRGVYVKRIQQVTFTGEEAWFWVGDANNNYNANYRPLLYLTDSTLFAKDKSVPCLCSHFKHEPLVDINGGTDIGCFISGDMIGIRHGLGAQLTTIEAWKEWLAQNNLTMQYVLASPIETPYHMNVERPADPHTYYPNTTITAEGAGIAVTYVADTKNYIDKKFAELAVAIVNN